MVSVSIRSTRSNSGSRTARGTTSRWTPMPPRPARTSPRSRAWPDSSRTAMNTVRAYSRDDLYEEICRELMALFGLRPEQVTATARLREDLDLDSIDAVDLVVRLQDLTHTRIKPEQFKAVRTVADVVDAVAGMLHV